MKWFRLHSEARNDAKLRTLTPEQKWVWFSLLCYASEQEERGCIHAIDRDLLAVECAEGDTELLNQTIAKLTKLRIVTAEQENVCFVNFMKRQYDKPSDTPERVAGRVSRHRAKGETAYSQSETPADESETPSNADVTPKERAYSETEAENTQKIQEQSPKPPAGADQFSDTSAEVVTVTEEEKPKPCPKVKPVAFEQVFQAYLSNRRESKPLAIQRWDKLKPSDDEVNAMLIFIEAAKKTDRWMKGYAKQFHVFLSERKWEDDLSGYADRDAPASLFPARASPPSAADTAAAFASQIENTVASHSPRR